MRRTIMRREVPPPRRELLFFWGGASRFRGDIRRDLWEHQANTTGFYVPISTFGHNIPPNSKTEKNVRFDHWMPRCVFCGSPPGWEGGDSDRYLPALVHGCTSLFIGHNGSATACQSPWTRALCIWATLYTLPKRGSDAFPRGSTRANLSPFKVASL